tara:strand:- start:1108 stop:1278 length:171 start_codon:yes stop_codon:yes gene_type:complete
MPRYEVEIVATLSKKILVVADDEQHAEELAHEMFTFDKTSDNEVFDQSTYDIREGY